MSEKSFAKVQSQESMNNVGSTTYSMQLEQSMSRMAGDEARKTSTIGLH